MKKLKLTLNKETIAKLEDENLNQIKGGFITHPASRCNTCPDVTCLYTAKLTNCENCPQPTINEVSCAC